MRKFVCFIMNGHNYKIALNDGKRQILRCENCGKIKEVYIKD